MIITSTAIIALRKENEIVFGADSQITNVTVANKRITLHPECKIKQVKNVLYAASGLLSQPEVDYSVDENAWASIEHTKTIAEAIKLFERLTRSELPEAINHIKQRAISVYNQQIRIHNCGILMIGFESGIPIVALLRIIPRKYRNSFRLYGKPAYPNYEYQRFAAMLGQAGAIRQYMQAHPKFWFDDPVAAVKMLLALQAETTPETVGAPFTIVRITKEKIEWIERGACQNSDED